MNPTDHNRWRQRFALFTALATLGLIAIGGLVTSHGVGMAVPDWPTSYGYNMFTLPFSIWFTGGVFHEHTHRQWASGVGILVVILTRWLGGGKSRQPLMIVGAAELLAGLAMFKMGENWRGAGGFLSGIGGVVLLAGIVWVKNSPAAKPLPALGWWVFGLVQLQGLLGGLRVILDAQMVAGMKLGTVLGIFHAALAQLFFVLICAIALFTSKWWQSKNTEHPTSNIQHPIMGRPALRWFVLATTISIFAQLVIGATMRHQHAGLAIRDFPSAYGKLWPDMSAEAVAHYNAQRVEVNNANPITAFQIGLQMAHRAMALAILICVSMAAWLARNSTLQRFTFTWLGLIFIQIALGAWTIWSDKAADVATLHVVIGALSLVTGALLSIIMFRGRTKPEPATAFAHRPMEALNI